MVLMGSGLAMLPRHTPLCPAAAAANVLQQQCPLTCHSPVNGCRTMASVSDMSLAHVTARPNATGCVRLRALRGSQIPVATPTRTPRRLVKVLALQFVWNRFSYCCLIHANFCKYTPPTSATHWVQLGVCACERIEQFPVVTTFNVG